MHGHIPLATLRAFEAAARLLSFTVAAAELNLTQSAVSQQIKQLEQRLGLRLFERMTRRLELTEPGRELFDCVRRALGEIDRTVESLRSKMDRSPVMLSAGTVFAANWLVPRLPSLQDRLPTVDVRLSLTDRMVDLDSRPEIDIDIRFAQAGPETVETFSRRLREERVFAVCSPALIEQEECPRRPSELLALPILHCTASETETGAVADWRNWFGGLGLDPPEGIERGDRLPRGDLLVRSAVLGQGVALVWSTMVARELTDGSLVKVFDDRFETAHAYVARCRRDASRRDPVRAVLEWLESESASA